MDVLVGGFKLKFATFYLLKHGVKPRDDLFALLRL